MKREEMKKKMIEQIRGMLSEVSPEKLRKADLWYMKRVLEVAKK